MKKAATVLMYVYQIPKRADEAPPQPCGSDGAKLDEREPVVLHTPSGGNPT